MPSFSYIARTTEGTLERGNVTAATAEEAREQLRKKHLFVEELQREEGAPTIVGFAGAPLPWTVTDADAKQSDVSPALTQELTPRYVPLLDTLRLFAGWLLAWYGLIYLLGSLQRNDKLPSDIPFLEGLFTSSVVLRFTFGTFLFLLLTSIHRVLGGGVIKGFLLSTLFVALMVLFHLNA